MKPRLQTWPQTIDIIAIYWALFYVLFGPTAISPIAAGYAFGWMIYRVIKTNFFRNGV